MRAAVLKGPGLLVLDDLPDPECPKGGALIRIKACSICGTDVKMLEAGHRDLAYPRVLGHEMAGIIVEIDGNSTTQEGDLAQVWPGIACGQCRQCRRGDDHRCQEIGILGFSRDGGLAQMLALPPQSLERGLNLLPRELDPSLAALAEPLACCLNGQERSQVSEGDSVLILGGGPIGCLHALLAEMRGAERIIVAERLDSRIQAIRDNTSAQVLQVKESLPLQKALASEIDVPEVDVILTATPEAEISRALVRLLSPGGRLCVFSGPRPENHMQLMDLKPIHYRELTLTGAYGCSSRHNREALSLLGSGAIDADWIITLRASLSEIHDAFAYSGQRRGLKSVICM
ncbi:MAG: alcohol dehydrogenase catalytic domain-containing protein [Methanotrichaceae archaeon]|nr:alcohol dehydrogenase catalytic domain-containing protein [Methanotrichaceae archaeon]